MAATELVTTARGETSPVPADAGAARGEGGQYLTFTLQEESFALEILRVREIIEYIRPTSVPMMAAFLRGVINLRGSVVPVIDLATRFGRQPTEIRRRTCIVIVDAETAEGSRQIGILVDAVNAVLDISADQIEPPPSLGMGMRHDFISGMGRVEGGFIILLDVGRVFSVEEMAALARLAEESPPPVLQ